MELNRYIDHTNLKPDATCADIQTLCAEAKAYHFASVCVNSVHIAQVAAALAGTDVAPCCVVGFPLGAMEPEAKAFEAARACALGAKEIDMVINIGWVRMGQYDKVLAEINELKKACGDHILKVIIETCLLTEEEKVKMCEVVSASEADFIKTSTGFSTAGATKPDVALMKAHMAAGKKIKAAGGIADFNDAEEFVLLVADRLGTSRLVLQAKKKGVDLDDEIQ